MEASQPVAHSDGTITGEVVRIDHFGNLITNLRPEQLPANPPALSFEVSGVLVNRLSRYYAEADGLLAVIGSSGYIEIAMAGGNAALTLKAGVGQKVVVITHTD
jgi:S-adenosylmethionine hydrolase